MPDEVRPTDQTGAGQTVSRPTETAAADFAANAKDLKALRDTVVDAAGVSTGLWLSYLFVFFYLAIAVGGVTHRDLFLENPVKLPFLNVDLPLIGFFVLGPLLFLIVHAYVLLHFVLLAGKVGAFHVELQAQITDEEARSRLRRQLPSNIFVQFLAGPAEVRTGVMGFMLRLIAQISLVLGPLALLVFFQFQFLPYHHEAVTWWQRIAVLADLVLLWTLWPSVARGERTSMTWRDLRHGKVGAAALASVVPILLVFTIATFPGEWMDENLPSVRVVPTKWPASKLGGIRERTVHFVSSMGWTSPHELLVAGKLDFVTRKPTSLWSNRLLLPRIDVVDRAKFDTEAKMAAIPETLSLRGRRLEGAVLRLASLRKVDFTGAHLQGANFTSADLREAKFECGYVNFERGAQPLAFEIFGAPDEDFEEHCTDLRGAALTLADLRGAKLAHADLRGAALDAAKLQGASLVLAHLRGASIENAELQGADLFAADLQGAWLQRASLQGASLEYAHLEGAMLSEAQLQGASLEGAHLQGATLHRIFVWRSDMRNAESEGASIVTPEIGQKYSSLYSAACPRTDQPCNWSTDSFVELKRLIEQQILNDDERRQALRRIAILDPLKPMKEEQASAKVWADGAQLSPSRDVYDKILAGRLREIGCDESGMPFVVHGLLWHLDERFESDSPERSALATAFLDEAHCTSARALSQNDKVRLRETRDGSSPAAKP